MSLLDSSLERRRARALCILSVSDKSLKLFMSDEGIVGSLLLRFDRDLISHSEFSLSPGLLMYVARLFIDGSEFCLFCSNWLANKS